MVSSRGILESNEVISRLAIKHSEFCSRISLAKSNDSLTLYSLEAKFLSIVTKNLAVLCVDVPMTERINQKAINNFAKP